MRKYDFTVFPADAANVKGERYFYLIFEGGAEVYRSTYSKDPDQAATNAKAWIRRHKND